LGSVRAAIATAPAPASPGKKENRQSADAATDLSADQLAMADPVMRTLQEEQLHAEQELRRLSGRYGAAYPQVITAKESLDDANDRVARRTALDNEYRRSMPQNGTGPNTAAQGLVGRSLADLKDTEQTLQKQLNDATQRMNALADERLKLEQNQEKLAQSKQDLEKVEARLESVKREGAVGGRLEVVSSGDVPISPAHDIRPRLAAGAALGGLLTPAGLIVLYSLMRRKYRYADDADAQGSADAVPLLGTLPELRKNDSDVESLAIASHCVHQIRMSVNASSSQPGSRTYLITSATAGEGKTTLTMSLGLSFAASRVRTLIIDADLVGRKLTSAFQAREVEGLHESIAAGTIRQRVRRTDSGLYILTAGKAGASDACAIPKAAIRAVIAEARTYFDVILVDSGPIMGSLEASVLAPEVDGVIFAITRGQGRQAADVAIRRLRGLGATVVGCVFNRAKPHDLDHSSYGSSSRMSLPDPASQPRAVNQFVGEGFGPVVQAVAAAMPESQN
jgi:capsular exopolysaccharide synthesis family protein